MRPYPMLLVAGLLSGCASMPGGMTVGAQGAGAQGAGQMLAIQTSPPGAACAVTRDGEAVGAVAATPGSIHVDHGMSALSVVCTKPGFQTATLMQAPKFDVTGFETLSTAGLIHAGFDAARGANYNYPPSVHLGLVAGPALAAAPAHALTPQPATYLTPTN